MHDGIVTPIFVSKSDARTIFLESNLSDNHFVVSVFHAHSTSASKPAIFTLHGWGATADGFYLPETSIGTCSVISVR